MRRTAPADATTPRPALPANLPPRGLGRAAAAEYLGISPSLLDRLVADRVLPEPVRLAGRVIFDRRALDAALDRMAPAREDGSNPWDEVL